MITRKILASSVVLSRVRALIGVVLFSLSASCFTMASLPQDSFADKERITPNQQHLLYLRRQLHLDNHRMDASVTSVSPSISPIVDNVFSPASTQDQFGLRDVIGPFGVVLTNSPYPLQMNDLDELHSVIQQTIAQTVISHSNTFVTGTTFGFVLLGDVSAKLLPAGPLTTDSTGVLVPMSISTPGPLNSTAYVELLFAAGVVSFSNGTTLPSEQEVNDWVKESINSSLVGALQSTRFQSVTASRYVQRYNSSDYPYNQGQNSGGKPSGGNHSGGSSSSNNSTGTSGQTTNNTSGGQGISAITSGGQSVASTPGNNSGVLIGSVVGAIAIVAILSMFLVRQVKSRSGEAYMKQRNSSQDENVIIPPCNDDGAADDGMGYSEGDNKTDHDSNESQHAQNSSVGATASSNSLIAERFSTPRKSPLLVDMSPAAIALANRSLSPPRYLSERNTLSPIPMSPVSGMSGVSAVSTEDKSVAGSDSDFTVNTEAGDSAALKSLSSQVGFLPGNSTYNLTSSGGVSGPSSGLLHTAESFERERPVNIRKDMLTSAWSGRMLSLRQPVNESVLQPSHFSASEERHIRTKQNEAPSPVQTKGFDVLAGTGSENSKNQKDNKQLPKNKDKDDSVVFAQANESEDVAVLTPPSQSYMTRSARPPLDAQIV